MMRQSLIAATIISGLAFSGMANATVNAASSNVSPGATAQTTAITYATRAGIQGVGFDANVTDATDFIVDASIRFQVFDFFAAGFVDCDGTEKTQAGGTIQIGCTTTGIYSIRTTNNTDVPNLNTNMRVLYDIDNDVAAGQTATVGFGAYCTGVQTPGTDGCTAFFLASTARDDAAVAPQSNNGTITLQGVVTPLVLSYGATPTFPAGNVSTTSAPQNLAVTATGNSGAATLTGCTTSAGFGVSPASLTFAAAGSQNLALTCTYAAAVQNGSLTCTETDADSAGTPRVIALTCPAGTVVPAPVLASSPPNGTPLTCNGAAGSTQTTSVTISNTGNADMTGVACNVAGAGFTLTTAPAATIAGPGSSNATVSCVVPADGAAPITGTLSCTTTAPGGGLSFPLSSVAQSAAVPTQPDIIPATSLWSKLGLIGLLAALGMLVVGFRRQQ